jgi:ABC-type sugar transport system permease subunit
MTIFKKGGLIPWLYMGSALFFLTVYLIYPVVGTAYISFLGSASEDFRGLGNYWYIFTNPDMLGALRNRGRRQSPHFPPHGNLLRSGQRDLEIHV